MKDIKISEDKFGEVKKVVIFALRNKKGVKKQ